MDARVRERAVARRAPILKWSPLKIVRRRRSLKYFKRVLVSPTAAMKMLTHTHSGCEKGMRVGRVARKG